MKPIPENARMYAVYEALRRFKVENRGLSPTVRELCVLTGTKSTSTISYHLSRLEEKGLIVMGSTRARQIELPGEVYTPPAALEVE